MKNISVIMALVMTMLTTSCAVTKNTTGKPVDISDLAQPRSHFTFTENIGQADEAVRFYTRITDGTVFITKTGTIAYNLQGLQLSETFIGNRLKRVVGEDRIERKIQFTESSGERKDRGPVVTYGMVIMEDVYPGINVVLRAASSNIEKIIWVKPGASIKDIRVEVGGVGGLSLSAEAKMQAQTEKGLLTFSKPAGYQVIDGKPKDVQASTVVDGNTYGFSIKEYDAKRDLFLR